MSVARSRLAALLLGEGVDPMRQSSDRKTAINFRRLAAMLGLAEDADFRFLCELADVGAAKMPHVAAVFERKSRWRLQEVEGEVDSVFCENHRLAEDNVAGIRRQIDDELQRGSVVAFSKEEALATAGTRLAIAALGAVPKKAGSSAVRIIHDATRKVEVNHLRRGAGAGAVPQD